LLLAPNYPKLRNRYVISRIAAMPPRNPFIYGEVVPAGAFVDREEELARLSDDLRTGQKIFLISPRRYGKSSLIRQALAAVERQGGLAIEITVSIYSSYVAFLEGFARAVAAADQSPERAGGWLRSVMQARSEVRYEADRPARFAVSFPAVRTGREISRLAEEVFALPAKLAERRGRRVAIALDEFQAIAGFNGGSVEHGLRAAIQQQGRVGYVFAGSEPSLMERMLGPKRPFYKAGPVMRLQKIPADVFAASIERRFAKTGLPCEPGLGASIVELAGNLPYDVQRLAHETWDDARGSGRRRVGLEDLHGTLRRLLAEQDTMFEVVWQRLTLPQRAALRAVVIEEGRELLGADVRARHRLGGASTVQASLAALVRDDVVAKEGGRYVVVDSLLREWVARRTY
jgi:hypothetical protein